MSLQEQLISNMFDPTNRLITKMVDSEALAQRNQGQQALAQGTIAQQALWTYDSAGRLVMRDIDEALALARGMHQMNQAQPTTPDITPQDLAQAILGLSAKIDQLITS